MKDKISIITICYNCRTDLERTIKSVLSQTYTNKEYIVVDGASTDGTAAVLAHYKEQIDILISEPDDGIYDALNKGVKNATGEWIICMNAGDVFSSEHILNNIFSQSIESDKTFIYSDFILCHKDGRQELRKMNRDLGEIHHQNAIYRRCLHQQYGYYIVTHPYTVSDLLFFLSIPANQYLKINTPIAHIKSDGISDGLWCFEKSLAAKVIYGIESLPHASYKYLRLAFGQWRQRCKSRFFTIIKNIIP